MDLSTSELLVPELIDHLRVVHIYIFLFTFAVCLVFMIILFPFYVYVNNANRERDEAISLPVAALYLYYHNQYEIDITLVILFLIITDIILLPLIIQISYLSCNKRNVEAFVHILFCCNLCKSAVEPDTAENYDSV
ncbi:unnamed protein product [Caenorhabditis nigoni]